MNHSPAPLSLPASLPVYDVRAHGATGDGCTLDTAAINAAIDAAHAAGGGKVHFPAGNYLSYSVRLRSRVILELAAGAILVAAEPPRSGESGGYDAPEPGPANIYQDFGHSFFRNSLIWGEELEDVAIIGAGRIYGRGLSRGNGRVGLPVGVVAPQPPGHLPDVLEADGPVVPEGVVTAPPGPFSYPNPRDTLPAGVGNKAIALRGCKRVCLQGITILHGGHFAVLATDCDDVVLEDLLIDTNRDGIDIDACSRVRIARCRVNSPWDDGICIKSSFGAGVLRPVEHVTITHCYVSGFEEGTLADGTRSRRILHRGGPIGRIKLGTEASGGYRHITITDCTFEFCRGLALELVDGAMMEDIHAARLTMREVMNAPIFVRVGGRLRSPEVSAPGTTQRITITDVTAVDVAPKHGIFIAGLPGHPVTGLDLQRIELQFRGGGTAAEAKIEVPEMVRGYPEPMLFGTLPSWGFYARHATLLVVRDLKLSLAQGDARPAIRLEDVAAAEFSAVRLPPAASPADWVMVKTAAINRRDCDGV